MNITLNVFLLTPLIVASYFFTPALQASSVDTAAIFLREAHDICRRSFGRADMPDALKEAAKKLNLAEAMLRDNQSDEPDRDEQLLIDIDILRTSAEREKGNPGAKMSASTRTPSDSTTSAQLSMLGSGQSLMQADQLHEEIRALRRDQKFEELAAKLKEYVALLDSCLSPGNPDQAPALARLTIHFAEENSFKLAEVYARRIVDDCEKRLGPDSLFLSMDLEWLAASQRGNENLKDAELTYRRIVAIREKAGGKNFKALPRVYSAIAGIYEDQCKWDLAEKFVKSAVAVREANYPAGDPVLANNAELYGDFHCNRGNLVKAEEFFKQALTIREKGYGPQAACLEGSLRKLSWCFSTQNKNYEEAEQLLDRALILAKKRCGTDSPGVATILSEQAWLFTKQHKDNDSESKAKKAIDIGETYYGQQAIFVAKFCSVLGNIYSYQKRPELAEAQYNRALSIYEKAGGADAPGSEIPLLNLGNVYWQQHNLVKAEQSYLHSIAVSKKTRGEFNATVAMNYDNLGLLYRQDRKWSQAIQVHQHAILVAEKVFGPESIAFSNYLANYVTTLHKMNNHAEADKLNERVIAIRSKVDDHS